MPNLHEILESTMLRAASRYELLNKLPFPIQKPQPDKNTGVPFDIFGKTILTADSKLMIQENPVWQYGSPMLSARNGSKVVITENVTCCVRDMSYMPMPVLDEIIWGPVKVFSKELGREVELPLDEEFLIRSRFVPNGRIRESDSGFWQLPASVDQSWEMIFGYEIPLASSSRPARLVDTAFNDPNLMLPPEAMVCSSEADDKYFNTLRLAPLRIIVCISLVCCKERNDFDPGSLFGGGRIYPLIMVMSSHNLDRLKASVQLTRPSRTMHQEMDGERMSQKIYGKLFADRNFDPPLAPPRPFWDILFDYFLIDSSDGDYVVVRPAMSDSPREMRHATRVPASFSEWSTRSVSKVAGQGEFDNLHFAPRMSVPADIIAANPKLTGMDDVVMAPFCVHDCLHIHWRWGTGAPEKHNRGWEGDDKPYAKPGAPLVPANQKVTLRLSGPSCIYTAEAQNVEPARWQIIMHHGAAYALSAGAMADAAMTILSVASDHIQKARPSWGLFYWYLRNTFRGADQVPRLSWDDQKLDALRRL